MTIYTYAIRLDNSRCLPETTLGVEALVRVYLPCSPVQLALYVHTYPIRLVNSRCLYKTNLRVGAIVHVNIPNPPSQLALFGRYYF